MNDDLETTPGQSVCPQRLDERIQKTDAALEREASMWRLELGSIRWAFDIADAPPR